MLLLLSLPLHYWQLQLLAIRNFTCLALSARSLTILADWMLEWKAVRQTESDWLAFWNRCYFLLLPFSFLVKYQHCKSYEIVMTVTWLRLWDVDDDFVYSFVRSLAQFVRSLVCWWWWSWVNSLEYAREINTKQPAQNTEHRSTKTENIEIEKETRVAR